MSAVTEALTAYRAAVDECRAAEYRKQQAAQALYEARQAEGDSAPGPVTDSGTPLSDEAFHATIAYVDEPTEDGRMIKSGAIDWQFGQRIPVTAGFEGGTVIGHAITSHIDVRDGSVMATVYIDDADALRRIGEPDNRFSLGVGLDHTEADMDNSEPPVMTITAGRLRQVAAQPVESAAWPGVVVKR